MWKCGGACLKGETAVGQEFKLTGKKNDLPVLVEGIVDEVLGMMDSALNALTSP